MTITVLEEWEFLKNTLKGMPPGPYALVFNPDGQVKTSAVQASDGSIVASWDWSWASDSEWMRLASYHPASTFIIRSYEWASRRKEMLENMPLFPEYQNLP
jgi:hypothetical protein